MIHFILNEKPVSTELPQGMVLLDFIRYHQHLKGTKIGCREGDCGACTVLVGEIKNNQLHYSSATSCLMPLGNAHLKHIVTIEGINFENELNPVQQAMAEEGATQCGFCTPGFVMSLAGLCLSRKEEQNGTAAIDGNICRCTGYKSIQRAAEKIEKLLEEKKGTDPIKYVTERKILPGYFEGIKEKLAGLHSKTNGVFHSNNARYFVAGGTDLYVQKHEAMKDANIQFLLDQQKLNGITQKENKCFIGPSVTVTDLKGSEIIQKSFPRFNDYAKLVSSTPIRNMATIAGNFVNASPIGDFSIFFLALDAQLVLTDGSKKREISLRKFYKGYKDLDKLSGEFIENIWFELPANNSKFNFEKVSKRINLDIASVNSAMQVTIEDDRVVNAGISAGGVGPVPMYLRESSEFLKGNHVSEDILRELISIAKKEIRPISDVRGSAEYKRLLLGQLIKAHFMKLFPELKIENILST